MERHTTNVVANILLIEDDDDLAELVQMHLKFQGHQVSRESSVAAGRNTYQQHSFDLVILDRGLPDGDGLDICHHLRQQQDWTPVLVLTARDGEMDKVDGLEADVDDYITKPFSVLEFQARVRNVLRRVNQVAEKPTPERAEEGVLNFGDLKIIPQLHQVSLNDKDVALTATEFTLLQFLATRPGRVYSKDELLDHVWNTIILGIITRFVAPLIACAASCRCRTQSIILFKRFGVLGTNFSRAHNRRCEEAIG